MPISERMRKIYEAAKKLAARRRTRAHRSPAKPVKDPKAGGQVGP